MLRAQETIARDRNHPSVIIWSIGNEDPFTVTHLAAIRAVKGFDPTRPLLLPGRADEFLPPEVDILAPHYRSPSRYDAMAATSTRPIITTEYTHAFAVSAHAGPTQVITGSRFTIWRPMGQNDWIVTPNIKPEEIVDLNQFSTRVKSWKVTETAAGVLIDAEADHTINDRNSFAVSYRYEIGRDGLLHLRYEVRPRIEFPWLPHIGVEFQTAAGLDNLRWLGLGPLDAYPNEKTAAIFGQYSGRVGSTTAKGIKAIRWAELAPHQRAGVRVTDCPYIRVEGRALLVLSSVVGRSEKYRRPEAPEYRLDVTPTASFPGGFSLSLVTPMLK